jgi:hypothetical protein
LELLEDEAGLLKLLKTGSEKAEAVASQTLTKVYDAMGVVPRGK